MHGGWSKEGITLYNTLVKELTVIRKKLNCKTVDHGNGTKQSKREFLNIVFYYSCLTVKQLDRGSIYKIVSLPKDNFQHFF